VSVFKEKNGKYEGANLLYGPMVARRIPSGPVPTIRFAQTGKTRLETYPCRFPVSGDRCFHIQIIGAIYRALKTSVWWKGGDNEKTS
jgi:hypothetical protein